MAKKHPHFAIAQFCCQIKYLLIKSFGKTVYYTRMERAQRDIIATFKDSYTTKE